MFRLEESEDKVSPSRVTITSTGQAMRTTTYLEETGVSLDILESELERTSTIHVKALLLLTNPVYVSRTLKYLFVGKVNIASLMEEE